MLARKVLHDSRSVASLLTARQDTAKKGKELINNPISVIGANLTVITFVSQGSLDGDDATAVLRLAGKRFCRIITFFSHAVLALRLCRNAAAGTTWRIYDLVVITTKGQGQARLYFLTVEA